MAVRQVDRTAESHGESSSALRRAELTDAEAQLVALHGARAAGELAIEG